MRFALGSRYALGHFTMGILLVCMGSNGPFLGRWFDYVTMAYSFPLPSLVIVIEYMGVKLDREAVVPLLICLFVANSYLWGYTAAYTHRQIEQLLYPLPPKDD